MSKNEDSIITKALNYLEAFYEDHGKIFVFHNYNYAQEKIHVVKEIAHAEEIKRKEYEMGLLALIFKDAGIAVTENKDLDNQLIIDNFFLQYPLEEEQGKLFNQWLGFLRGNQSPKNNVERLLRDGMDIHLCLGDTFERISLLRLERETVLNKIYTEEEWFELCKRYFITHVQYTGYAIKMYGAQRARNFNEIEKRLEKLNNDAKTKQKKNNDKNNDIEILTDKESEDYFKIAFRNYATLISVADRKAGLLIQVNSILSSVIIAFSIRHVDTTPLYLIPTSIILLSALITVFYAILASKPQEQAFKEDGLEHSQSFFFGSFDRIDPGFKNITLLQYEQSMQNTFRGNKNEIFGQVVKESYQVRKVLSLKFGYLSVAYKVFITGLSLSVFAFIVISLLKKN